MSIEIPGFLETQVREGNVVLFLGAGASLSAADATGRHAPSSRELAAALADRFLGGRFRESSLSQVSELAINEADVRTVQEYLREIFASLEPTAAHLMLPSFRWWGLATTNYDLLVEKAYGSSRSAVQAAVPFIENGDRVQDRMRDPHNVMLLKLHGCVTRIANPACPLILTVDQYVQYRKSRDRIFDHLFDWAYEKPILFIGHSLQDSDLRAILLELHALCQERPHYYAVTPDADTIQSRFWEARRVTLIKGSFHDFMQSLDGSIPSSFRALRATPATEHPISQRFVVHGGVSFNTMQFLNQHVCYVKGATSSRKVTPQDFYRGLNPEWSAIEQGLDVKRDLHDEVLAEYFMEEAGGAADAPIFVLLKAHAGSGKTVLLRRLAWDAAHELDRLCLYLRDNGVVDVDAIRELLGATHERIYLFIDNLADHLDEVTRLLAGVGRTGGRLTIVGAERANEWAYCDRLFDSVTEEYEVKYLTRREITELLALLEKNGSLGTLNGLDAEARLKAFAERAGRQLLVALHEATFGKPFEEIIEDEYYGVMPERARLIYLTICVLNRLGVPVRAGIVSRLHGVPFTRFVSDFFRPLEGIVFTHYDTSIRDNLYEARHPHVAEIVFDRVLKRPEDRYDIYVRCLDALNVDFKPDRIAFGEMIRGRNVLELFPDHDAAVALYKKAREKLGDPAFLLQQMAIYELHRPSGSISAAIDLLQRATEMDPRNGAIRHSLAEAYLTRAEVARTALERSASLDEARRIATDLRRGHDVTSHTFHTLAKVNLKRLTDFLEKAGDGEDAALFEELVKDAERSVREGLQRFPGDSYLLDAESKLAKALRDSVRAKTTLERAFAANPRSPYLAQRLAAMYRDEGDVARTKSTLISALDANRNDKGLHYAYGRLLVESVQGTPEEALYHLQRSFTEGDANYDARILCGRQMFALGKVAECKKFFRNLEQMRCPPAVWNQPVYPLNEWSTGTVERKGPFHCFIARHGDNEWIHAQRRGMPETTWAVLAGGKGVQFRVAFTLKGPTAVDVSLTA